ncbi:MULTISPECIES: glycosyltransferase family 2 protein [Variovorax]|uniref:glycosyltransferase family 2 protein n=1 Tax=Variovorax TaxID=34072 RepID=UPI00086AD9C8|nr:MULTISPECIES: glycosyltransferase [Variovorax]MBN8757648.1 glycosyltransferase family 2 protein [Variovorax sp.]ODU14226.1 MAG: glycosyl transferase [Variovorax sp. SCN 67-85]ODV25621.1 MAG: glycosyl transferase [Variovorax sp. SCN 67-20]OJZ08739.1 MAG: glycosyl transferase [Variovorax sp. 67-131]UKI11126.1 glycosyltransferase family 2 protein [Variovorax paradoxus]
MNNSLQSAFVAASPRLSPPATPLRSWLIHGGVLVLWGLLFAMAFRVGNVGAWSVGVAYVLYDTVLLLFVGWMTLPILRPRPPSQSTGTHRRTTLGVIVASHNECAVLPVTLAALLGQTDVPDRIVIADDGSSDGTAELLTTRYGLVAPALGELSAASATHPALYWLRLPHGGKAVALNAAILCIDTDTVLTVDGDTLLDSKAIAAVRRAFSDEPNLVAATGVITPVCSRTLAGRCFQWFQTYEYIRNFLSRYAWMRVNGLLLISGAFAGFRTDAVRAVGGFDTDCLVEDYELIHRLHRHAQAHGLPWTVRVLGDAQAHTDAPSSTGAFLRQRRRWFGGFLQTQYWYRAMVGDRRYGWLGIAMLPVKAIDTLQPLYGLAAFGLLLMYLVRGNFGVLAPVAGVIGAKIVLDLLFHLWSVFLYRRWIGQQSEANMAQAFLAALVEPFTFQILRHTGAAWGWWTFLTGRGTWGRQTRVGLVDADGVRRS